MTYRTHSLFHYTKSIASLRDILETGRLFPNYCLEDLSTPAYPDYCLGIPQVCFCDIPISRSQFLVEHYGKYAIAIDKGLGIKYGVNPVQYVSNEAIINNAIQLRAEDSMIASMVNEKGWEFDLSKPNNIGKAHNYMLGYMKKYEGEWKKKPYCNYEENEWRFVVKDGVDGIEWKTKKEYLKWRGNPKTDLKPAATEQLKRHSVPFDIGNLRHIILYQEREVFQFVDMINSMPLICGWHVDDKAKKILLTKITSFERIRSDY